MRPNLKIKEVIDENMNQITLILKEKVLCISIYFIIFTLID